MIAIQSVQLYIAMAGARHYFAPRVFLVVLFLVRQQSFYISISLKASEATVNLSMVITQPRRCKRTLNV